MNMKLGFPMDAQTMNASRRKQLLVGGVVGLLMLGCTGNGSNGNSGEFVSHFPLAPGNYQLVFSVDASATSLPVTGLELTVQLPKGITIATDVDGRILPSALSTGSAVKGSNLITGRYVASTQQAVISLTAAATASWNGEFAKLNLAIPSGVKVSEYSFESAVASGFPRYKAVGLGANHDVVVLTDVTKSSMSLKNL